VTGRLLGVLHTCWLTCVAELLADHTEHDRSFVLVLALCGRFMLTPTAALTLTGIQPETRQNQPWPRPLPARPATPQGDQDTMTTGLDLTKFKALSFDCYGTLIDWEAGIAAVLAPWAREQGLDLSDEGLLLAYADNEAAVERETPAALYPDVLAAAFRRTGGGLHRPVSEEWAQRLGNSVPDWPAFPDSADALARLARHYQLIIVSNVHRDGFAASNQRLHGDFAAVITAEDVGAYKPAENHFRALDTTLAGLGVDRTELLHVAQLAKAVHVLQARETEG
jgi:putative hydrolase of the HAD superfamily